MLLPNFTSQSRNDTSSVFLPVKVNTKMGNCFTAIFSDKSVQNDTKMDKRFESEESDQIPSVAIDTKPAPSIVSFQSELELSVRGSCATVGFDGDDESSSSGTLLFDSEDECEVSQPQEEALNREKKSRQLARNTNKTIQLHGLGQQNDVQSCTLPPVEKPAASGFKNRRSVKEEGNNARDLAIARQHSHASHRTTKPIKREEKAKRKPRRFLRKKRGSQDEKMQTDKVRLIKRIKDAVRRKVSHDNDSGCPVLPPDKIVARIFNADVEDCSDSRLDDGARRSSSVSTWSSTATLWDRDNTLGEDIPEKSTGHHFREVPSAQERKRVTKTRTCAANSLGTSTTMRDNHGKVETKNRYMGGVPRPAAVTPWYSSTSSEEDLRGPKFRRPYRGSKSTTMEAQNELQMMAGTPPSTNSWDSASTLVESEKSSASCNENDVSQTPKDQRIEKNFSTAQSPSSASLWKSTSNCKEYAKRKSSESVCNMQRGVGSRVWFRFKNYKITPQ